MIAQRAATARPDRVDHDVTIVHDYFTQRGGAERVVERLAAAFPSARVLTSVVDAAAAPAIEPHRLTVSSLQRWYDAGAPLRSLAPFLGGTFRRLDVGAAPVVLSSSSAFAHQVGAGGGVHVCYCHTPPAFLHRREYFTTALGRAAASTPVRAAMCRADRAAAQRVDVYIANSAFTAGRIRDTYGIEASVLHPPIDTAAFTPTAERSGRFLVVSRLRPHKAVELAIRAANELGAGLDVVGEGSDRARLERLAGPTVRFLGRLPDEAVASLMARCVALVVPGVEDFGMVTAEVQAAGRPPIGSATGGTTEIVTDGVTGFLVHERTPAGFAAAMRRAVQEPLDAATLVAAAARFDVVAFVDRLDELIAGAVARRGAPVAGRRR